MGILGKKLAKRLMICRCEGVVVIRKAHKLIITSVLGGLVTYSTLQCDNSGL